VKLTAPIQLITTPEQRVELLAVMERINALCNWLSERAFAAREFHKFGLQKLAYHEARDRFGTKSQITLNAIAKVCNAYKATKAKQASFRHRGAIAYSAHYGFTLAAGNVTICTLSKWRLKLPYTCGALQRQCLEGKCGQADLVYRGGQFYLHISVEAPPADLQPSKGFLGVDLGSNTIAADSDGLRYSGDTTRKKRERIQALRSALQSCGTRSAKRHLKRLRNHESNFHKHTNHEISKALVSKAKGTGRGIAVENLTGITRRVTVRKAQRAALHSWSFFQLKQFISYKALLSGVQVVEVNPAYTSQTCPECRFCSRRNRPSQAVFRCIKCGYEAHADFVGARNIATRALVGGPIVTGVDTQG
jgi:IS605 OrfB family transposase